MPTTCSGCSRACSARLSVPVERSSASAHTGFVPSPRLEITYCRRCRFLPRASWIAQELLTTFADELGEVALIPGDSGVFQVRLLGELISDRASLGRFPDSKELKQLIRDRIAPGKSLGHSES